jgi:glycogen operon protein
MQRETSALFVNGRGQLSIRCEFARKAAVLFVVLVLGEALALAQIDRLALGARFNASGSQLTFRVYSSHATRIELYLYAQSTGADELAHVPLNRDSKTFVWSTTVPLTRIRQQLGIRGTIYYGYRAWGPNWSFDPRRRGARRVS